MLLVKTYITNLLLYKPSGDSYAEFFNPFRGHEDITTIWGVISLIASVLVTLGSLVAIGYIVYGGYMYITSAGNPETSKQAAQSIIWSIIGLIVIMLAYMIIEFVINFVETGQV